MADDNAERQRVGDAARAPAARRIALAVAALNAVLLLSSLYPVVVRGEMPDFGFYLHAIALTYTILGVLIIIHQPRNTVGWLILVVGTFASLSVITIDPTDVLNSIESDVVLFLTAVFGESTWIVPFFVPVTLVLQIFPDGRLPSPRWRVATAVTLLGLALMLIFNAALTWTAVRQGIFDPDNWPEAEGNLRLLQYLVSGLMVISLLGSLAALVYRYRRSEGIERYQLKWLAYTALMLVLLSLLTPLIFGEESVMTTIVTATVPIWFAVAITVAILRYRLFDIDILIRRTLQYGLLTAVLVGVYFGAVLLAQSVFVAVTGQENPIAIVVSTLVIAALFNPLRRRIQDFIDHRFYRKRYDATRTLARFAQTARDEVDLDQLSAVLMRSVNETMRPETAGLWLNPGGERER